MNQSQEDSLATENKAVLYWLLFSQFIYICSLAPWLGISTLSVMAFDQPGSENNIWAQVFVLGVWSYPVWLFIFSFIAWVYFQKRKYINATIFTSMPILIGLCGITTIYIYESI